MVGAVALIVLLVQPLLIIFAGLVFAAMLDGGVRLLGRVLPIGRGWRLLIVVLLTIAFLAATFYMTGVQVAAQVNQLRVTLEVQAVRVTGWLTEQGLMPGASDINGIARQALGSVGRITSWVGTAVGALTTMFMILVIGLFVAMDPKVYDRGLQWMVPQDHRTEFAIVLQRMGKTLRRLLFGRLVGMFAEGVLTWFALMIGGVPMALILGILTGLLAFIPNIGAFISGALMIAVGFSAGTHTGFWAIGTYLIVQTFDGYVLIPIVAKRTVDLPPALTLGMPNSGKRLVRYPRPRARRSDDRNDEDGARTPQRECRGEGRRSVKGLLYDYWRSSASYRVRICLNLKRVAYEIVPVNLVEGAQTAPENRSLNPQGFVPTLVVDGRPLVQSLAIVDWLDATFPDPPMVAKDPFVRSGQLARALVCAADIHPIDNLRVLKRLESQFGANQAAKDAWYRHWVVEGLTALEAMAEDGPFLGGDAPDISDVCLIPQLYNARRFDVPLDAWSKLLGAEAAAAALPAFQTAHPDRVRPG